MIKRSGWACTSRRNSPDHADVLMRPIILYLFLVLSALQIAGFRFQADEWITECEMEKPDGDCSIIGVFHGTSRGHTKGSFSLAIDLQSFQVAVVGEPHPIKASIKIDKHPRIECVGERYCLMSAGASASIIHQLETGNLILLDAATAKETFLLSMTTLGYKTGLAKIRAHRDLLR